MVFTRRGKVISAVVAVLVVAAVAVGALVVMGKAPGPIQHLADEVRSSSPPPICPLTGLPARGGKIPERPALAIKVENLPDARPQYGLGTADIVYEEPVEGGITRFIVVYHCADAARVEPVRSARTTDPEILVQLGTAAFGYADAARYVQNAVQKVKQIDDVNWQKVPDAYHHDPNRAAPHDLYTSTDELWAAAKKKFLKPPTPIFSYGEMSAKSKKVRDVRLYFSDYSDVHWAWSASKGVWLRYHGSVPHRLVDDGQVEATNVLIQIVEVQNSSHKDAADNPVPVVALTGSGKAYLLRDGRMYSGKWQRASDEDLTTFSTASGKEFVLAPGETWVELFPKDRGKPEL